MSKQPAESKELSRARLRAVLLLAWCAATFVGFGIAGATWYEVTYQLDSAEKRLFVSGAQAFSTSTALLWLFLAAAVVACFTPKPVARVVAILSASVTGFTAFYFSGVLLTSGDVMASGSVSIPPTVSALVSKASGISDSFTAVATAYVAIWVVFLTVLTAIQIACAASIHLYTPKNRSVRFEISNQAGATGSKSRDLISSNPSSSDQISPDPISLWDSQG